MTFGSAIIFGIGFMIGVLVFIIGIVILIRLLKGGKGKEFTPEMFEEYKKVVIADEKYEEAKIIEEIISGLKANNPPKQLLKNYEIKNSPELILDSKGDDKTSIKFIDNPRVVLKSKNKDKN